MKNIYSTLIFSLLLGVVGCHNEKKSDPTPSDDLKKSAIENYSNIVYANYSDALSAAKILQTKISDFIAAPDDTKFQECKDAWIAARVPYNQTDSYRFYDGPIDDANGPEGLMNAWPLDEAYIDYVNGNASSGIINDGVTVISAANLAGLNQSVGETSVSTGYHAIEFLLWGQDLVVVGTDPGQRPYTDYLTSGGTASNQARRAQYLQACADLLVQNLQSLVNDWAPNSSFNYRASFTSASPDESIKKILQGMGTFSKGELAGERMAVALQEQLQEHEHSCFSDNTHNDIRYGAKGIQNVYTGIYIRTNGTVVQGTSIYSVIAVKNPTLASELNTNITASVIEAYSIPAPFDQAILAGSPGRAKIQTAITSLRSQGDKIVEAASDLGLGNISVE
jgi:putative iron-regulated protein